MLVAEKEICILHFYLLQVQEFLKYLLDKMELSYAFFRFEGINN